MKKLIKKHYKRLFLVGLSVLILIVAIMIQRGKTPQSVKPEISLETPEATSTPVSNNFWKNTPKQKKVVATKTPVSNTPADTNPAGTNTPVPTGTPTSTPVPSFTPTPSPTPDVVFSITHDLNGSYRRGTDYRLQINVHATKPLTSCEFKITDWSVRPNRILERDEAVGTISGNECVYLYDYINLAPSFSIYVTSDNGETLSEGPY